MPIIGYDDLIKSKTLTNRLKDLADIEELTNEKKGEGKEWDYSLSNRES